MTTLRADRPRRAKWASGLAAGLAGIAAWGELAAQPPAQGPAPAMLPRLEPTPHQSPANPLRDNVQRVNYPQFTAMPAAPNIGPYSQPPAQQPALSAPVLLPYPTQAAAPAQLQTAMPGITAAQLWGSPNSGAPTGPPPANWGAPQQTAAMGMAPVPAPQAQMNGPAAMAMPNGAPYANPTMVPAAAPRVLASPQSVIGGWGGGPGVGAPGGHGFPFAGAQPGMGYGYGPNAGYGYSQGIGSGLNGVKRGVAGAGQQLYDSTVGLTSASIHAVSDKLKDCMFGYPEYFAEPPLGAYRDEFYRIQRSKADVHKFTLYRSDFLAGTDKLSPTGAARLNLMACRINGWLGPVVIEWTPEEPPLAEARKAVVLTLLQNAGLPVVPERLVVAPPLTIGLPGVEADIHYNQMLTRYQGASPVFPLPPQQSSSLQQSASGS